jgi:hypothetical protein
MKKVLAVVTIATLVALAVPVWAQTFGYYPGNTTTPLDEHCDVSLDGQVTFKKDVTITQKRDDTFYTNISVRFDPKARADAEAVKNDLNYNNYMEVGDSHFTDNMNYSFSNFIGIGQSNQATGQMNNQGNVAAVAFVSDNDAYASSLAAVGVSNKSNEYYSNHRKDAGCILDWWTPSSTITQTDNMKDSFNCFIGIGQSNQSAGSMNNQNNDVAVAAGVNEDSKGGWCGFSGGSGMVAMAGSELAMTNSCNRFQLDKATFTNNMNNSFNGFVGIGQSNQSAGNMNNQANVVSVAAAVSLGR